MAIGAHLALLRSGMEQWNAWRAEHSDISPDLRRANLHGAQLRGANLSRARLSGAKLSGTDLIGANLCRAHLRGADLHDAHLRRADLREADLRETTLNRARLRGANLHGANLSGAHLYRAYLYEADLSEADLRGAELGKAKLIKARLIGVDLTGASLVSTNLVDATLASCNIHGVSAWNVRIEGAIQANLRITPDDEPEITVDNLEVAQFLYMLLQNQRLRAVLDTIASKVVLILGRFSTERKLALDTLRESLRNHPNGYIPVLFDFAPQQEKPVFDTVKTLANLARFIIADLTDPNMVRSELTYITANVPTVPVRSLIEGDAELPTEYATWERYNSFLPVYRYANLKELLASLDETVIQPVERLVHPRPLDGPSPNTPEPT